jgi:hypothetical protein
MTFRKFMIFGMATMLGALILLASVSAQATSHNGFRTIWDNFHNGFSTGGEGRWFYFAFGPYIGDDGIETTASNTLKVVASGVNPGTGKPAFVRTTGQESDTNWLPGGLDHVKWLVYMNHLSSNLVPGFDAVEGQELVCETWMSAQTYGTENHPFGNAVVNANDDLRLAGVAMNTIDFETFMVFDFFLTNEHIYAFYERLPFGRDVALNNTDSYAAFSYMIPVAERSPREWHHLEIAYDRSAGTVRWLVDDVEVFRVDEIGYRINPQYLTIDHGGIEEIVSMNQLNCGMGMFTLLDGYLPSEKGLVRLSNLPNYFFDPSAEGDLLEFEDEESLVENRLFGQGAELRMRQYVVKSRPVGQ